MATNFDNEAERLIWALFYGIGFVVLVLKSDGESAVDGGATLADAMLERWRKRDVGSEGDGLPTPAPEED